MDGTWECRFVLAVSFVDVQSRDLTRCCGIFWVVQVKELVYSYFLIPADRSPGIAVVAATGPGYSLDGRWQYKLNESNVWTGFPDGEIPNTEFYCYETTSLLHPQMKYIASSCRYGRLKQLVMHTHVAAECRDMQGALGSRKPHLSVVY